MDFGLVLQECNSRLNTILYYNRQVIKGLLIGKISNGIFVYQHEFKAIIFRKIKKLGDGGELQDMQCIFQYGYSFIAPVPPTGLQTYFKLF